MQFNLLYGFCLTGETEMIKIFDKDNFFPGIE
jgi:hypothetical protein